MVEGVKDYAIFMLDPYGYVTTWNEGAQRIKGYDSRGDNRGALLRLLHRRGQRARPPRRGAAHREAPRVATRRKGLRVRKDGSTFWANVLITALRDEEGELKGFAKVTRDITARQEAEERERLLAQERVARERTTDILESISDAFYAVDRSGASPT